MYNYEKYGCPFKRGNKFFYFHNSGLQNQSVLYSQPSLDAPAEVFVDPNTWSEDGTAAIGSHKFSE
jgi:prolyl oligopeptidase